ncbi:helix-turn-helix domain-containing protein [Capillimicrobium parvum]|uniref:helix-turn-helix domain-containing protein n=1 Tax=Capillimicrobium parvum TaxID=2884022 RepID=UPI00216B232E|nr:XRE family transcriptional regulator [Capillimicrobium parvum]
MQEPEAVAPNGAVVDVGAIVGLLRRKRGMSLDELATRSDLSPSFISAVERGKSDIALGRLARIAAVFGLDVASLLTYSSNTSRPRFLSSDDRTPVDRGEGVDYRRLRLPGVDFELITVTFEPRTAFRDALAHDGIDIVYVPVGSVVLDFDGVDYVMNAGDSGVWSGRTPHAFRNDTDSPAQLVAVVTDTVWDL